MHSESSRIEPLDPGSRFAGDHTREVIGAFYEVYNTLRPGLLESAYAGALEWELMQRGLSVEREVLLRVRYKEQVVGAYRADLVVEGRLLLELKALAKVGSQERRQLVHYLRLTGMPLGLLFNFGPSPEFFRVVNNWHR